VKVTHKEEVIREVISVTVLEDEKRRLMVFINLNDGTCISCMITKVLTNMKIHAHI
jgi:hypothetical protein